MLFSTAHQLWCNSVAGEVTIRLCGVRAGQVSLESGYKALGHIGREKHKPWTAEAAAHVE